MHRRCSEPQHVHKEKGLNTVEIMFFSKTILLCLSNFSEYQALNIFVLFEPVKLTLKVRCGKGVGNLVFFYPPPKRLYLNSEFSWVSGCKGQINLE